MNIRPIPALIRTFVTALFICPPATTALGAGTIVDYVSPDVQVIAGVNFRRLAEQPAYENLRECLLNRPATAAGLDWLAAHGLRPFPTGTDVSKPNVTGAVIAWKTDDAGKSDFIIIASLTGGFRKKEMIDAFRKEGEVIDSKFQETTVWTLPTNPKTRMAFLDPDGKTIVLSTDPKLIERAVIAYGRTKPDEGLAANPELAAVAAGELGDSIAFVAGVVKQDKPAAPAEDPAKAVAPGTPAGDNPKTAGEQPAGSVTQGPPRLSSFLFKVAHMPDPTQGIGLSLTLNCPTETDTGNLLSLLSEYQKNCARRWPLLTDPARLIQAISIREEQGKNSVRLSLAVENETVMRLLSALTPGKGNGNQGKGEAAETGMPGDVAQPEQPISNESPAPQPQTGR